MIARSFHKGKLFIKKTRACRIEFAGRGFACQLSSDSLLLLTPRLLASSVKAFTFAAHLNNCANSMNVIGLIRVLVPVTLIEMMIAIGLSVGLPELAAMARNWRLIIRVVLANYLCVPLITVGLLIWIRPPDRMVSLGFLNRRIEQVAELAVCLAATLGTFDARLDKLIDRLPQPKGELQKSKAKTILRIRFATFVTLALIVSIEAGQIALAVYGCRGLRRRQIITPPQ
jgi:hypothetical protein